MCLTNGKAEKWIKKTCLTLVMLRGCALLLFLESVQGTRSELAGHDSANQESCRANKISEKAHESVRGSLSENFQTTNGIFLLK